MLLFFHKIISILNTLQIFQILKLIFYSYNISPFIPDVHNQLLSYAVTSAKIVLGNAFVCACAVP